MATQPGLEAAASALLVRLKGFGALDRLRKAVEARIPGAEDEDKQGKEVQERVDDFLRDVRKVNLAGDQRRDLFGKAQEAVLTSDFKASVRKNVSDAVSGVDAEWLGQAFQDEVTSFKAKEEETKERLKDKKTDYHSNAGVAGKAKSSEGGDAKFLSSVLGGAFAKPSLDNRVRSRVTRRKPAVKGRPDHRDGEHSKRERSSAAVDLTSKKSTSNASVENEAVKGLPAACSASPRPKAPSPGLPPTDVSSKASAHDDGHGVGKKSIGGNEPISATGSPVPERSSDRQSKETDTSTIEKSQKKPAGSISASQPVFTSAAVASHDEKSPENSSTAGTGKKSESVASTGRETPAPQPSIKVHEEGKDKALESFEVRGNARGMQSQDFESTAKESGERSEREEQMSSQEAALRLSNEGIDVQNGPQAPPVGGSKDSSTEKVTASPAMKVEQAGVLVAAKTSHSQRTHYTTKNKATKRDSRQDAASDETHRTSDTVMNLMESTVTIINAHKGGEAKKSKNQLKESLLTSSSVRNETTVSPKRVEHQSIAAGTSTCSASEDGIRKIESGKIARYSKHLVEKGKASKAKVRKAILSAKRPRRTRDNDADMNHNHEPRGSQDEASGYTSDGGEVTSDYSGKRSGIQPRKRKAIRHDKVADVDSGFSRKKRRTGLSKKITNEHAAKDNAFESSTLPRETEHRKKPKKKQPKALRKSKISKHARSDSAEFVQSISGKLHEETESIEEAAEGPGIGKKRKRSQAEGAFRPENYRDQKKMLAAISDLLKIGFAYPFAHPVHPDDEGCSNYLEVIKNPLDLGTISDRLEATTAECGFYTSMEHVMEDIDLVWKNCVQFNGTYDPIIEDMRKCQEKLPKLMEIQGVSAMFIPEETARSSRRRRSKPSFDLPAVKNRAIKKQKKTLDKVNDGRLTGRSLLVFTSLHGTVKSWEQAKVGAFDDDKKTYLVEWLKSGKSTLEGTFGDSSMFPVYRADP